MEAEISNFAWPVAEKQIRLMDLPALIELPRQLFLAPRLDALHPLELT
jgi:hypothetical protein